MSYVDENLIAGEVIQYRTGLHWIVLFWPMLFALLFAFSGLGALTLSLASMGNKDGAPGPSFLLPLVVAACFVAYGLLRKKAVEMAVTNKRIVIKQGIFARRTFEVLLSKVESIGVDEGIVGRTLGYGTVVVRGTGGTPEPFKRIEHPLEFRRQVQQQIEMYGQQERTIPIASK